MQKLNAFFFDTDKLDMMACYIDAIKLARKTGLPRKAAILTYYREHLEYTEKEANDQIEKAHSLIQCCNGLGLDYVALIEEYKLTI